MKVPLKTILKNFLNYFDNLEVHRKLGNDHFDAEFQELKILTDKLKDDPVYSASTAMKDINRPKNRYKDIVPYDFSRVILPKYEGIPGSDYINASYIKNATGAFAYIAAQGPLSNTVIDFWRMIWVCDVQVLVMACNEQEAGKHKCEIYWPEKGEIKNYGTISVELVEISQVCTDFLVRTLLVKYNHEMRDVYQFHYTSWPDHSIPDTVQPILELVHLMRECQTSETIPILIHCSAGCGRTGSICAIDYVWSCLRQGKLDDDFCVFHIALELRKQRIAMIQTKEQYILVYRAIARMFEQQLKKIDSHPYVNIDENGDPIIWKELSKNCELHFLKETTETEEKLNLAVLNLKPCCCRSISFEYFPEYSKINSSSVPIKPISVGATDHSSTATGSRMTKINTKTSVIKDRKCIENNLVQSKKEDIIPFIDDDVGIRPNCGRAYLDIPNYSNISILVNSFDPFVDKVFLESDDSSDGNSDILHKMLDIHESTSNGDIEKVTIEKKGVKESDALEKKNDNYLCDSDIAFSRNSYVKSRCILSSGSDPPATLLSESLNKKIPNSFETDIVETHACIQNSDQSGVMRKSSTSRLKLLKNSQVLINKVSDGSKHHSPVSRISRAGSAPPCLDSIDNATKRKSILMVVARKFRSSSVKTERELNLKHKIYSGESRYCSNTFANVRDRFNTLTRAVSFNLSKGFNNWTASKGGDDNSRHFLTLYDVCNNNNNNEKSKSLEQQKCNSIWYDKPSLPHIAAVIKPHENNNGKTSLSKQTDGKYRKQNLCSNCSGKSSKNLSKSDAKNSTVWYSEVESPFCSGLESRELISFVVCKNSRKDATDNKILPFSHLVSCLKNASSRSSLRPECSKKSFEFHSLIDTNTCNSKFYTNINDSSTQPFSFTKKNVSKTENMPAETVHISEIMLGKCEKQINVQNDKFTSDSNCGTTASNKISTESSQILQNQIVPNIFSHADINIIESDFHKGSSVDQEVPPALPKKLIIGKNKNFCEVAVHNKKQECVAVLSEISEISTTEVPVINSTDAHVPRLGEHKLLSPNGKKDYLYSNVNIKTINNMRQIEETLQKCPRNAIIDLTSQESYSMEEELVSATNLLTEFSHNLSQEEKVVTLKHNCKYPGYEVIWPDEINSCVNGIENQQLSSEIFARRSFKQQFIMNKPEIGLCYSPPVKRNVNVSYNVSKSQSCINLNLFESNELAVIDSEKLNSNSSAPALSNEMFLDTLTDKTLLKDVNYNSSYHTANESILSKKIQKPRISHAKQLKPQVVMQRGAEMSKPYSVTLVTKSSISCDLPKEEEIVFHFPPPPPIPPPTKKDIPCESFNIICKSGSMIAADGSTVDTQAVKKSLDASVWNVINEIPQGSVKHRYPDTPHILHCKNKGLTSLQRSASYSILSSSASGSQQYENTMHKKCQTLTQYLKHKTDIEKGNQTFFKKEMQINTDEHNEINMQVNCRQESVFPHIKSVKDMKDKDNANENPPYVCDYQTDSSCASFSISKKAESKTMSVYNDLPKLSNQLKENAFDMKKKLIPSKKRERAPQPPCSKQSALMLSKSHRIKCVSSNSATKKLTNAFAPPLTSVETASSEDVKKVVPKSVTDYENLLVNKDNKFSVSKTVHKDVAKKIKNFSTSQGLSHSQSDVSVFLALKETKCQLNPKNRTLIKPFLTSADPKHYKELVNVSNSEVNGNYSCALSATEKLMNEENGCQEARVCKLGIPVAPPRTKRRSTVEVNYAKVNSKFESFNLPMEKGVDPKQVIKNNTSPFQKVPPAIPLKTKNAFEIPEIMQAKGFEEKTDGEN